MNGRSGYPMPRSYRKKKKISPAAVIARILLRFFTYLLNVLITVFLICLITGMVVGSAFVYYVLNYIDTDIAEFDMINTGQNMTTKIYYMDWKDRETGDGVPVELEDQRLYGAENRMWASYQSIPKNLRNAFVAIEDKRYWDHNGVDLLRSASAAYTYFFKGINSYGASTITQQLIKNVTGDGEVTVPRKIQEIMRAIKLSEQKDKTEILEMYLNLINLSQGCYGVQAAAYTYFGKDVSDLTLIECAAIAAITQAPTKWDPIQNPDNNKLRRDLILSEMFDQSYITQSEFDGAYGKELVLNVQSDLDNPSTASVKTWYTDAVINEAIDLLIAQNGYSREVASRLIYTAGYKIITAMDPDIQDLLDEYFADSSNFEAVDTSPIQPQASMVIIDHRTGDVLGIAGGRGIKEGNRVQNYATQTVRSPGSSIKPLSVYAPALENGLINYATVFDDTPVNFGDPVYEAGKLVGYSNEHGYPSNFPDVYNGLTTVGEAVRRSVNTVSLKVLEKLTLETSFDFLKNKLHMKSLIEYRELTGGTAITDMDYSALGLGGMNYGLTVLEMTAGYQIFPNNGVYNKPRIVLQILDGDDNVILDNRAESEVVISGQSASIMTKMMESVVRSGTAAAITVDSMVNVAGKTGTTTKDNDRWFIGYTPYLTGGVWFGYDMPRSLSSFKESPALKIWDDVMTVLHEKIIAEATESGYGVRSFVTANGVIAASYCMDSGKLMTDACRADPRGDREETGYFTADNMPSETCDCHVLVDYDRVTKCVAGPGCPAENIRKVGLIKVTTRKFPVPGVVVTDAQFVYRELPAGIQPGSSETDPFFINAVPAGTYVGTSGPEKQYNCYCTAHWPDAPPPAAAQETEAPEDSE